MGKIESPLTISRDYLCLSEQMYPWSIDYTICMPYSIDHVAGWGSYDLHHLAHLWICDTQISHNLSSVAKNSWLGIITTRGLDRPQNVAVRCQVLVVKWPHINTRGGNAQETFRW